MKNLSKERFWDGIYENYPYATKEFCDWIDQYKKDNNWRRIFKENIKYHHLPIEMQVGLWIAFEIEMGCENFTFDSCVFEIDSMYEWISENLRDREITLLHNINAIDTNSETVKP